MTTMTPPTSRATYPAAPDQDWRRYALCRQIDPELFFPTGSAAQVKTQREQAKMICGRCPVREACLRWALDSRQDIGVWGGLSEEERRGLHKRMRPVYRGGQKTAVDNILENRLDEFQQLVADGGDVASISKALGTNAVTVMKVMERLAEQAPATEVQS